MGVTDDRDPVCNRTDCESRAPDLYCETQLATLTLRFNVGDIVQCSVDNGSAAEGVIVQRFYREEEWPRGYYAAVRAAIASAKSHSPLDLLSHAAAFLCSTKCGCIIAIQKTVATYSPRVTRTSTSGKRLRELPFTLIDA